MSFITNLLQGAQSAASCSTAQYKQCFQFWGGAHACRVYLGLLSVVILIVAILIQCMAQAARIGFSVTSTPATHF